MKPINILLFLSLLLLNLSASAQIGYQVSLLNNATGEARANERVTVKVKITDSDGKTVCEETKTKTSNDFGVVSMSVGDSETFANADWSKLPFFIEASVDGRLLGKSQLLSVPVAEYAKHSGSLTKELLCAKSWDHIDGDSLDLLERFTFLPDGTFISKEAQWYEGRTYYIEHIGIYEIVGNVITMIFDDIELDYYASRTCFYNKLRNVLIVRGHGNANFFYQK